MRCGLERPRRAALRPLVIESKPFGKDRAGFEAALQAVLDQHRVELICLGGFMRLFTADFVQRWYGRMLNIHPSLLPSFPGPRSARPGAARRREDFRRDRAFRDPRDRCRADPDAGRGRRQRSRHGRRRCRSASSRSSTASIPMRCGCLRSGAVQLDGDICKTPDSAGSGNFLISPVASADGSSSSAQNKIPRRRPGVQS